MIKFLVLDTAKKEGVVALCSEEGIERKLLMDSGVHSNELGGAVNQVWQGERLDFIGVGLGPGSFTGLRTAIAFAKGINIGSGVPLVGISSMDGYSSGPVVFDARAGGVYLQLPGQSPQALLWEEFMAMDVAPFVSPDAEALLKRDGSLKVSQVSLSADRLASAALALYRRGDYSKEGIVNPYYLRPTQAERALRKSS